MGFFRGGFVVLTADSWSILFCFCLDLLLLYVCFVLFNCLLDCFLCWFFCGGFLGGFRCFNYRFLFFVFVLICCCLFVLFSFYLLFACLFPLFYFGAIGSLF